MSVVVAREAVPPQPAISSAHPLATRAGMEVLGAGGNAFDAAVAVSAVLAVVEPYSSGMGGGGFWLLHRAADGFEVVIDGREKAPLAATRDMYLDSDGDVLPGLSVTGALAAAIPGEPAALVHIAGRYGRLPLQRSLLSAIRLARDGFLVDEHYRRKAGMRLVAMQEDPETARIFLDADEIPDAGTRIRQSDLAGTLESLALHGRAGFYAGPVAKALVDGVQTSGGIWTTQDMERYRVLEREPLQGEYQGLRIVSVPLPSSGGIVLLNMLNILKGYTLQEYDPVTRTHLIIESMRRAYRDRAEYLGDSDFVQVPVTRLLSRAHADAQRSTIDLKKATPSSVLGGYASDPGGQHTTHFSILDGEGNRVAATLSINSPFGACIVPLGTGVLLNNEMNDFSVKPGEPNMYGLVGSDANAIAPGKRPLSSMTPVFAEDDSGVAILGTPGGSRIITMVLLGVLELAAGELPDSWVALPRFHHQFLPDVVQYEPGALGDGIGEALVERGHALQQLASPYGNMQAIYRDKASGQVFAASDPRGGGAASVGLSE
ncbi:MAG TPA: gamma-glutamyltransferase [Gammaproteobacteria bacterium]|nr:gamma-glutamyltransferase [Gammaproteobacteria bacterium]